MIYPDKEKIQELIKPLLEKEGFALFDINFSQSAGGTIARIFVDRERGGIRLDECAALNISLGEALDAENIFSSRYVLEVSSPGMDRPLKNRGDFLRVTQRKARFILSEPVNKRKEVTGLVKEATEDFVLVSLDSGEFKIPIENIIVAKQII